MSDLLLFHCSHGADDPERATIPFVAASVAAASGLAVRVVCTIDAVWLGTSGGADGITSTGQPPLADLLDAVLEAGGELWLCSACTGPRGISEADVVPGARITGAAEIVAAIADGARSVTLA